MLPKRGSNVHSVILYGIGVVCLCVVMYMLGSTMTLWTMEFELDPMDGPPLEGFSLPTTFPDPRPAMPAASTRDNPAHPKMRLNEQGLFRPPITMT